jgi:glycosyltransferase involved in cell wall biosynthesis
LEPFGLVAIEAMACGCLPIVSNVDGLPEAVGNAGYIVKEHSVNAFYNAIVDLHNNQDMEFIIRKNACDHLKKHVRSHICEKYKIVVEAIITT